MVADTDVNRLSIAFTQAQTLKRNGCPVNKDLLKSYEKDLIDARDRKAEINRELQEVQDEINRDGESK